MKAIGYTVVTIGLILLGSFIHAFLVAQLYEWFVCTAYNVPPINLAHAYGIGGLISYITYQDQTELTTKPNDDSFGLKLAKGVVKIFIRFGITYFISWMVYVAFIQ